MDGQFSRTINLLGEEAFLKLQNSSVIVFGLGGVGGFAADALVRNGVGRIGIVDADTVSASNINRQLFARHSTVGRLKTDVAYDMLKDVNPDVKIEKYSFFYDANTASAIDLASYDYVVDAIDTVTAKLLLIEKALKLNVPIVSCMGTGNKLDPTLLRVADISKTHSCPLAKVVRKELKDRGIESGVDVVFSAEIPAKPVNILSENGRHPPASASSVPGAAGLALAAYVTKKLAGI